MWTRLEESCWRVLAVMRTGIVLRELFRGRYLCDEAETVLVTANVSQLIGQNTRASAGK